MRSSLFSSYERSSFLSTLNPSVKLAVSIVFMVVATGIFDMVTLGMLFVLGLIGTLFLGRVHPQAVLKGLVPFALFALGYLWMNALFPRVDPDESTVLLRLGPVTVIEQGVLNGLTFGLRALGFGVYSMLFVSTTEPTDFVLSLVRQLKIPPRIAYGTLAAYRYLPMLESEFQQIRAAHRIRGVGEGMGLKGRIVQIYRYTVPLLASAIRQAGRVADAMESRGFTGSRERSYYREVRLKARDGAYAAAALGLLGAVLLVSAHFEFLSLWSGTLWS